MTTIYLIRHNEPDRSVEDDLLQPLTLYGKTQIPVVTEFLKDKRIDAIYSSDCRRTMDTISGFVEFSGLPMYTDIRLREGILGCPPQENPIHAERQWSDPFYRLPEGESLRQVQDRMIQCLTEIRQKHCGSNIAICSHGTAMCTVASYYSPEFGWQEAKAVKRVWPWILRLEFDEADQLIQWEEMLRM